jgi:Uncharacterized protein conserved in bacteria
MYEKRYMKSLLFVICLYITLLMPSCAPAEEQPSLLVSLVVDGRQLTFEYRAPVTVAEFLRDAEVETGDKDRIDPPLYTQITDGMRVTVVRVREQTECERQDIPFRQRPVFNEGLRPGEELLAQAGQNGIEEICYSVRIEDGVAQGRSEISRVIVQAPQMNSSMWRPLVSWTRFLSLARWHILATAMPGSCAAAAAPRRQLQLMAVWISACSVSLEMAASFCLHAAVTGTAALVSSISSGTSKIRPSQQPRSSLFLKMCCTRSGFQDNQTASAILLVRPNLHHQAGARSTIYGLCALTPIPVIH